VDLPDGSTVRYSYDPLHRRVQSVHGGQTTRYAWDAFNLAAVYDGSNHLVTSYVTLPTGADANDVAAPAEALERIDAGGTAYFVHDGSDSTTALTDATGAVTSRYRYNTAGLPATGNGPETGYTWIGAQYDAATGLYYLNDRYYDPAAGRFISEDPASAQYYNAPLGRWTHTNPAPAVGHPVSFNRYAYAGNDPVDASDPSGDGIRAVLATAACALTLLSGSGVAEGTAFQEPLEKIVECIEQYVDDKKEREEAIELAEELAEADEEPVAELIIDDIGEEIVEIYEISIEITIVEEL
jgi:RHS repeat-associated protein